MTTLAGLRPNHYETLGLRPDATAEEIERAFRHELNPFMPHVVGGVAAASVAYATLRDPAKRRAYDEAHGFARPAPPPATQAMLRGGSWTMGNANLLRAMPRLGPDPAPVTPAPAQLDRAPLAASPVEPVAQPARAEMAPPFTAAVIPPLPVAGRSSAPHRAAADGPRPAPVILGMDEAEDGAIDGRKGMAVLGAIGAVALVGGLLGWVAGSDAGDMPKREAVVSALPKAAPRELSIITPVAGDAEVAPPVAATPRRRPRVKPQAAAAPSRPDQAPAGAAAPTGAADPPVDALAPAPASSPAMPLSNRAIAGTIERIGYSCGTVTATEAAGGGVYTVSCSSGQRFRASPRNGRYRFKRI